MSKLKLPDGIEVKISSVDKLKGNGGVKSVYTVEIKIRGQRKTEMLYPRLVTGPDQIGDKYKLSTSNNAIEFLPTIGDDIIKKLVIEYLSNITVSTNVRQISI